MKGYLTPKEYSEIWHITDGQICYYIRDGRIPGVIKEGRKYYIPEGLEMPHHKRVYKDEFTPKMIEERKKKKAAYDRQYYKRWKSQGICYDCKTRPVAPGCCRCQTCLKRANDRWKAKHPEGNGPRMKERVEKMISQGLCRYCGKPAVPGITICEVCRQKNKERQQVKTIKKRLGWGG